MALNKIVEMGLRKLVSKFKAGQGGTWPSAYGSGALVKCRKVGAKNWGNKSGKKKKK